MSSLEFTDREGAPFSTKVWERIDEIVRRTAADEGFARKILRVDGPLGIEARVGIGDDLPVGHDEEAGPVGGQRAGATHIHLPATRTMPLLHQSFRLGLRSVEAFDERGEPLDTRAIAEATRQLLASEDRLVFQGVPSVGIPGILTPTGAIEMTPGDWSDPARAADDLIAALTRLDESGRHGPYVAALSPDRYYALFRPLESGLTPFTQLAPLFEAGIVKAPGLRDAAIVLARDDSGPKLMIGQDVTAAYDGREGVFFRFSLLESVTVLPGVPGSVVALRAHAIGTRPPAETAHETTLQ